MDKRYPALGFVGPLLGRNPGYVLSQSEIVATLLAKEGYAVRTTSAYPHPLKRLVDIIRSLLAWRAITDVVILEVFSGRGFLLVDVASLLAQRLKLPLIQVLHGGDLPHFTEQHPRWVRRVLHRADQIISPSTYLAHHFSKWGFDVSVIPNVLQLDNYPFRRRHCLQPKLLWMRTFHSLYHPQMAVAALSALRRREIPATLTMAGADKGLLASVRELVAAKNLGGHVHFPGFLDMAAKQQIFDEHDIYLHTNRADNMPVSVVEAAAFGLPIVATRVGGIPYLLQHEETALLVENEDVDGMANAVQRLLDEPSLAARFSESGRRLAERSDWPNVRQQWEALFSEVMARD